MLGNEVDINVFEWLWMAVNGCEWLWMVGTDFIVMEYLNCCEAGTDTAVFLLVMLQSAGTLLDKMS